MLQNKTVTQKCHGLKVLEKDLFNKEVASKHRVPKNKLSIPVRKNEMFFQQLHRPE